MTSTSTDRRQGVNVGAAVKVPCRVATTANITLSGEQTIDGVAIVTGDRVLVKNQTTGTENGIYDADSAEWSRAKDFDGAFDILTGTLVTVLDGSANSDTVWRVTTSGTITIDSSSIAFESAVFSDAASVSFLQSGTGAVSETVQTALRRTLFAGQYSSVANFNTARAALTGTMGISPTVQFANVDPTSTTPAGLIYGGATFNGTYDPVLYFGYNIGGATGDTRVNTSEPMLKVGLEGHYYDGATHWMEWNWDYVSANGLTTRRVGSFTIDRATHALDWDWAGPTFQWWKTTVGTGASFKLDLTNGDNTTIMAMRIAGGSDEKWLFGPNTAGAITSMDVGFGASSSTGGFLSTTSTQAKLSIDTTDIAYATAGGLGVFSEPTVEFDVARTVSGNVVTARVINKSNTASSNALIKVAAAGSSGGDAVFQANIDGVVAWGFGCDNSDSDAWVISSGGTLGTSNVIKFTTAGVCTIPNLAGAGSRTVVADANGVLSAP